ncbi:MAG: hypothetical protein V4603_11240 [Pseudomonadota bacterium]
MQPKHIKILAIVLALLIFIMDLQIPLGVAVGVLYTGIVLLAEFTRENRFIRYMAFLGTALTIIAYFYKPEGIAVPWMVIANRVLSVYVIWVTALLGVRINSQHQEEVRSLSGLLPICAWCKKIRDDKGYWNQLETYIKNHTEADFSHSICPVCMDEHFGDEHSANKTA